MSIDYSAICMNCKQHIHLGQCMGGGYSLSFGPKSEDKEYRWIMEWIADHVHENHIVRIVWKDKDIEDSEYIEMPESVFPRSKK